MIWLVRNREAKPSIRFDSIGLDYISRLPHGSQSGDIKISWPEVKKMDGKREKKGNERERDEHLNILPSMAYHSLPPSIGELYWRTTLGSPLMGP